MKNKRKIIICTLLGLLIAVCAYAAYRYSEKQDNVSDANTAVQSEKTEDKKDETAANKPKPEELPLLHPLPANIKATMKQDTRQYQRMMRKSWSRKAIMKRFW